MSSSNAEHCNNLYDGLNKLSDAMSIIDVVALNEDSIHGNFCRALSRLMEDAFDQLDKVHSALLKEHRASLKEQTKSPILGHLREGDDEQQ